jgi:hypothetical protein
MMNKIEIMDNRTTIEVDKTLPSYTLINFNLGTSLIELMLSPSNFEDLGNKLFPKGLMPDTFADKVDMLNELLEELSPVIDINDTDWCISKVTYNHDADTIYYESEEI